MTPEEIAEFRAWHEWRITELHYPVKVEVDLRLARERWLMTVKRR
jgi:hypothetical protein